MSETGMILEKPLLHEKRDDQQVKPCHITNASDPLQLPQAQIERPLAGLRRQVLLLVLMCLPFLAYSGLVGTGYFLADQNELAQFEASIQTGWITAQEGLPDRPAVRIQDMPAYVTKAIVAIEDHRFYQHAGVDPRGLLRAVYVDLLQGQKAQGGSTITMQLARNLFLTQDKTFLRKGKEIALALYLDQAYTKQQILEMYVNQVYYGHGKYGIESAAALYFGKTVETAKQGVATITENEAAMLAGLLKSPEIYSPLNNRAKAEQRQQVVLKRMKTLGLDSGMTASDSVYQKLAGPVQ